MCCGCADFCLFGLGVEQEVEGLVFVVGLDLRIFLSG